MTNDAVIDAVAKWIASRTNLVTIRAHEGGKSPPLPYVMVSFLGMDDVRQHEQDVEYFDEYGDQLILTADSTLVTADNDTATADQVSEYEAEAVPVVETEWRFSIHAYGSDDVTGLLRPVRAAARLSQAMEPMFPFLVVHRISQVRNVPDWINNQWQPRAQMDFYVRGMIRDGMLIDVIEQASFIHIRAE